MQKIAAKNLQVVLKQSLGKSIWSKKGVVSEIRVHSKILFKLVTPFHVAREILRPVVTVYTAQIIVILSLLRSRGKW